VAVLRQSLSGLLETVHLLLTKQPDGTSLCLSPCVRQFVEHLLGAGAALSDDDSELSRARGTGRGDGSTTTRGHQQQEEGDMEEDREGAGEQQARALARRCSLFFGLETNSDTNSWPPDPLNAAADDSYLLSPMLSLGEKQALAIMAS
jgi:hypothetical protein